MGSKSKKARKNAANNKKRKLGLKPRNPNPTGSLTWEERRRKKQQQQQPHQSIPKVRQPKSDGSHNPSTREPPSSSGGDRLQMLLEPYSKDQLIGFLCDAALSDPGLLARIRAAADRDVSHRKIFVHGLPWDATIETLLEVFSPFGPVEECNVVTDKVTGRCKGYGFVLFQTRSGAVQALKQPQKAVKHRVVHCQLASAGPVSHSGGAVGNQADTAGRKIYVSNVHKDASPDKLKAFFAKFGEIELGPMGFDMMTGKSRGYAIFVYKTQDGARKALMEPHKMFEGHQLHCQWHAESAKVKQLVSVGSITAAASSTSGLAGPTPQPVLAAVAAAQNLSLYQRNPAYAQLLAQNPLLAAAAGINQASALSTPAMGGGLAGYGGNTSLLGSYGSQGTAGLQGMQFDQSSLGRPSGSHGGMPSYLWLSGLQPDGGSQVRSKVAVGRSGGWEPLVWVCGCVMVAICCIYGSHVGGSGSKWCLPMVDKNPEITRSRANTLV